MYRIQPLPEESRVIKFNFHFLAGREKKMQENGVYKVMCENISLQSDQ